MVFNLCLLTSSLCILTRSKLGTAQSRIVFIFNHSINQGDKCGILMFRNLLILHLDSITNLPCLLIYGSLMSKIFPLQSLGKVFSPKHKGSIFKSVQATS